MHGIMTSALWAIARTPALVEAVDRVETTYGEVSQLSDILSLLRRAGADDLREAAEAAEAADAFLLTSRLTLHDNMEPMDAIRGILGLCGDSEQVLEEAVSTTYRCAFARTDTCLSSACGASPLASPHTPRCHVSFPGSAV